MSCKDFTVSQQLFQIWKCSNCTFLLTQFVPGEKYIGPYYQSATYVSHSNTKEGVVNRLYHIVRNYTLKTKQKLVTKVTGLRHGSLLDVGAGTGAFTNTMERAGWNVTGLEPDETARQNANASFGVNLKNADELFRLPASSFDAITLWHVLEHVHQLHRYLETFRNLLKPEGRLIIAVPNFTSYDADVYKEHWAAYDVPRHLYHFSPRSMEVLLESKVFSIETIKPMWFDSFYVSMLSEQYKTGHGNILRAFWTGLLSNMKASSDNKKCSSVIYIIRKK
ncbi:MAG: class SAM-dependent methyltransferase [Segetibacter sp.]|nr:class SAM-dependent methyltransferase [Segetibacter sp.]